MHLSQTQRRLFPFLIAFLILGSVFFRLPFYNGDGQLQNNGLFRLGYKHELIFDSFLFEGKKVQKVYSFVGVPSEKYTFRLDVLSELPSNKTYKQFIPTLNVLENSAVEAELKLRSNRTNIHIRKSPLVKDWIVSYWSFWRTEFSKIKLSKRSKYQLELTVSSEDSISEPVTFQPILVGGARNVF